MTRIAHWTLFISILCSGCGTPQLTPGGANVRLVEEEPEFCHFVGEISRNDFWWGDRERVLTRALNTSAEEGADTLIIDRFSGPRAELEGRMFRCSEWTN